jgi:hypothetical protein
MLTSVLGTVTTRGGLRLRCIDNEIVVAPATA